MILTILGQLTDLNPYINAERGNRFAGAKIKAYETARVAKEVRAAKLTNITVYPVRVDILWITKDARIDADNLAFAKKFILDGLVAAGVLEGDGRKHVAAFSDDFAVEKDHPRVEIAINPC